MNVLLDFLKGLVSKTYKFFAPSISATSTAVDESVIIEFAKCSGTAVEAVTNGLGECVGYVSTNVVSVSNGASKTIGTVIDFASKQVVATEELLATESIAGGETITAGSTVTEITANTTTTAMLASPVASVGACVLTAIAGLAVGKEIGDALAKQNPDFWVGTVGKALYEAGCTLSGKDPSLTITYMNSNGETFIPKKTETIIKNELTKAGALKDILDLSGDNVIMPRVVYFHCTYNYYGNPVILDVTYTEVDSYNLAYYRLNGSVFACYDELDSVGNYKQPFFNSVWKYNQGGIITTNTYENTNMSITIEAIGGMSDLVYTLNVPVFDSTANAIKYLECGKIDTNSLIYIPDDCYISPTPSYIPNNKIRIGDLPATDDDTKASPVPGIVPNPDTNIDPKPNTDPVKTTDSPADNPEPYIDTDPIPGDHIPDIEPAPDDTPSDPVVPVVPNMIASAISRVFNPTQAELDALGAYLWSSSRLDDLLKLFQNPVDGIISLHAIYGTPSIGADTEIKLGYLPTGVSAPVVTSQFVVIDCGAISISEKYNNATDYAPYTTVEIYLPFIGIQNLNPFDIIGSTIKCTYKIDVYTGACIAQLNVERSGLNGVVYEFAGNCAYQIPLTSGSFLQAVANVIGGTIGGAIIGGGAGAIVGGGSALLHANVDISRSGNLSANAGILGNRKPYFIITRSIPKDAYNYSEYYGYPSNKTIYLRDCTGFTRVKDIILHTSATQEERDEIMKLLKSGIYI